jgi:hypothetical protein
LQQRCFILLNFLSCCCHLLFTLPLVIRFAALTAAAAMREQHRFSFPGGANRRTGLSERCESVSRSLIFNPSIVIYDLISNSSARFLQ